MTRGIRHAPLLAGLLAMLFAAPVFAQSGGTAMPVSVEPVKRITLKSYISAEGLARALRRDIVHFDRAGRVAEIGTEASGGPLREGSEVKGPGEDQPGTLIARLAGSEVEQQLTGQEASAQAANQRVRASQASLAQAQERLSAARDELERTRKLADEGVVPRKQLTEAQAKLAEVQADVNRSRAEVSAAQAEAAVAASQAAEARLRVEGGVLRATFDGVIAHFNLAEGQPVGPLPDGLSDADIARRAAAVIIDPTQYEVVLNVPSLMALNLAREQEAQITWAGLDLFRRYDALIEAGQAERAARLPVARASVFAVAPAIVADSRSVRVRLRTTEGAARLLDGLYVSARITDTVRPDALTVPMAAISYDGPQAHVFVVSDGKAERKNVVPGFSDGRRIEILSGLDEGAQVIVKGHAGLLDGMSVTPVGGAPS